MYIIIYVGVYKRLVSLCWRQTLRSLLKNTHTYGMPATLVMLFIIATTVDHHHHHHHFGCDTACVLWCYNIMCTHCFDRWYQFSKCFAHYGMSNYA